MKLIRSLGYAYHGLIVAIRGQVNLRIHLVAASLAISTGFYFHITTIEWAFIIVTIGLVISLELVNTSIEYLSDLVTLERKPLAGKVKDIAAAAVLVSSIAALAVGFVIFSKYFFKS